MQNNRTNIYRNVTGQIVAALQAGVPPWVRPWSVLQDSRPRNALSQRPYRGINTWLLQMRAVAAAYPSQRWLTYRQAQSVGAQVRRGEAGTAIVFYQLREMADEKPDASTNTEPQTKVVPFLRTFTVFNTAQIDNLPSDLIAAPLPDPQWSPDAHAEAVLARSGADIRHGGAKAYYQPAADFIQLPPRAAFPVAHDYYATALHELTHWTGHASRCNRVLANRFGEAAYAMEELIAEIGSAYLCAHCRLDGQLQHPSYIAAWLKVLQNDQRAIFTAAAKAQVAADYLLPASDQPQPRCDELAA